jgi:hypothetical protein
VLKKSITYEDFDGNTVTEDHYFHLSKADLIEMEMSHQGGMHEHLQRIVASEDGKAIIAEFKELILSSYGKRSDDGKRFIKTQELREEFQSSEAYSALFMELCLDTDAASDFVSGIIPAGLDEAVSKLTASTEGPDPTPQVLSSQEIAEMDSDELKSGLATGRYRLGP